MISERVQNYIDNHAFCSEYLFRDWESFLDLLYTEGGRISSILWWDHCTRKQLRESVGNGGYRNPDNEEFIYAETQLYKEGLETYTLDEIKAYINQERETGFRYGSKYRSYDLVPSFYLADCVLHDNREQNMKEVILSADGDSIIYLVPDVVAENLEEYGLKFCSDWLRNSPDAERYRVGKAVCYTESDFIEYLNTYVFPDRESKMIKNIGWTDLGKNLPEEYRNLPYYNF